MSNESGPELKNFWNLGEAVRYLRLSFAADDPMKRTIARQTFLGYWLWPLITVGIIEGFWHAFFHFFVGW